MNPIIALLLMFSTSAFAVECCNCVCPSVPSNPPVVVPVEPPAVSVVSGDPGGAWIPFAGRLVADQSGDAAWKLTYAPGCLNGAKAPNSSSGCSAQSSFNGFSLGNGKSLLIRYKSTPTAGSSVKFIRTRSYDGGNVGYNVRVWLSADPMAIYANIPTACKQASSRTPMVVTGPGYCPIAPNTVYYYGMEYDEATALRFSVEESRADFN